MEPHNRQQITEAAEFIRRRTSYRPTIAVVLGSGLAALADAVAEANVIDYGDTPYFPVATVEGHPGRLVLGHLEGKTVAILQGRAHFYEGYSMAQVTFPIRVLQALGVRVLIITNAAGGLNPTFRTGEVMLITDHINLVGMAGLNPLRGPTDPELGPRFQDMSDAYDPALRELALQVAAREGIPLRQGIYIMLAGPSFETPADVRFIRMIGADAVGMSTVPEVIVARHGGMRVLGLSGISNTLGTSDEPAPMIDRGALVGAGPSSHNGVSHEEVLEAGRVLVPQLLTLIRGIIRDLDVK